MQETSKYFPPKSIFKSRMVDAMATSRQDSAWRSELILAMMEHFHSSLARSAADLPNGFFWRGCPTMTHITTSVVREMIKGIIERNGNLTDVASRYDLLWEQVVYCLIFFIESLDDSNDIILSQLAPIDLQPDLKVRIDPAYARKWVKEQEKQRSEHAAIAQECRVRFLIEANPLGSPRRLRLAYMSELLRLGYSTLGAALALAKVAARKLAQREADILNKGSESPASTRIRPNYTLMRTQMLEWMLDYYEQRGEYSDLGPLESEWWVGLRNAHESPQGVLRFEEWLYSADPTLGPTQFFFQSAQL
ncbi:hypothetical protein LTR84_012958 [Exophiala bonariae]|uniref:Transcription factor domain-containing protein n=1 Tax=Exophiala bonariae TaxID=1690606 RepID=A0AAV9NEE9_9EURO|nr:hypothetical protein LTR84_012958 [Exophiala bonariae]